jgi:hypothetical protein
MDVEEGIPQLQVAVIKAVPKLVVPTPPREPVKRETKTQRRVRIAEEITANLYRIKDVVDLYKVSLIVALYWICFFGIIREGKQL